MENTVIIAISGVSFLFLSLIIYITVFFIKRKSKNTYITKNEKNRPKINTDLNKISIFAIKYDFNRNKMKSILINEHQTKFLSEKVKELEKIKKFKSEGINSNCVKLNNVMKVLESNKNRINLTDESFYRKKSFSNNFDDVYQISKESESDFWYFLILNPENEIKKENQNNLIKKQEIGFILKYKKNFDAFGNNNLEKVSFKTIFNEKNNVSKEKSVDLMHEIFVN